jgi:phosphatidylinositol alpha-1,6-mannosyltransferase
MSNEKITKLQENVLNTPGNILGNKTALKEIIRENVIKKKILFVTRPIAPPWDEASKNMAYQLAINVAKINPNLEIHLMTKGDLKEAFPGLPDNIIQHSIYTSAENDFTLSQKIRSILFQWQMKNKFDVVHYFFTPSKLNGFVIKKFLKSSKSKTIQTIATLRDDLMNKEEIKKSIFGDILITYSKHTKKKLKSLGFSHTHHIYPGIDLGDFKFKEKNASLLRTYNFKSEDFIIGFTGEYVRLGGIDNIIESFVQIIKQIPEAKLFLNVRIKNEKDAAKKEIIVKKLKKLGITNKVIFANMDYLKKWGMSNAYNLYDIALFPIHNMKGKFDVPLVVPEAMACRKVNILSNLPLLKEFANHSNAVMIEKNNTEELTQTILDLYNNPEKREKIATNGMNFVRRNFNIEFIAEEYNDLYDKL